MDLRDLIIGNISQQEYLNYKNVSIRYAKLPKGINGFVFKYKDIFVIVISDCLSYYKKRKTILHELAHIELSHLYKYKHLFAFDIDKYEDEADRYIKYLEESL